MVQGAPVEEVALRARATKPPALGFDRAPTRALNKVAVKARRAFDKAAKQAAQQGGSYSCPPIGRPGLGSGAGPQTPAGPSDLDEPPAMQQAIPSLVELALLEKPARGGRGAWRRRPRGLIPLDPRGA